MTTHFRQWRDPQHFLHQRQPDQPVLFFAPDVLAATYGAFRSGFPGLVTYAVKANPDPRVLQTLVAAGMAAFDVASTVEIATVQAVCPDAKLHFNNPVRARPEIAFALKAGVRSFSVDREEELDKLVALCPPGTEITVRFKLPVAGAAYDFGAKFGADMSLTEALLQGVAAAGFIPSLGFHPGTQCGSPAPWAAYVKAAAELAQRSGVTPMRLNVGGGMPGHRNGLAHDLDDFFHVIGAAAQAFAVPPALLCEPGRAMVSEAMTLALRVRARCGRQVFLNDGLYGSLAEFADIGPVDRVTVLTDKPGAMLPFEAFGPTCDSLDRLNAPLMLPDTIAEGDYVLFAGMGAYSSALATRFNGFGAVDVVPVARL